MLHILVINPGSTSTKIAVFQNEHPLFVENITHTREELSPFLHVADQFEMRSAIVHKHLAAHGIDPTLLQACVGRGGLLPPVQSGAYAVNDLMLDVLCNRPRMEHASNLGALIAAAMARPLGIPAYIYDPVTVDEMDPIARITGLPEIRRHSVGHMLNMRACALRYAHLQGHAYEDLSVLVVHLGGGITLSLHQHGRIVDMISDDEGPFAPERAGGLPSFQLAELVSTRGLNYSESMQLMRTQGGLTAWFGTADARDVEKLIHNGDAKAALVYEAMAYEVAKNIGKLAVVSQGKLDAILLTGGLACSTMLTEWISQRVSFLAPVQVFAGENEMESLALGALRVLRGEETAHVFTESPVPDIFAAAKDTALNSILKQK